MRFLIHDRRQQVHRLFEEIFRSEGIRIIQTPIPAPQANAYPERFVRSVGTECLDWLLILSRRHLELVLPVSTAHYNRERPHRGLALLTPVRGQRGRSPDHRQDRAPRPTRRAHTRVPPSRSMNANPRF